MYIVTGQSTQADHVDDDGAMKTESTESMKKTFKQSLYDWVPRICVGKQVRESVVSTVAAIEAHDGTVHVLQ